MTDNRATELLCKLLEERGEDYVRNGFNITWSYYSDPHTATESIDGTLIVTGLTPEQAIAATLGSGECEELLEELRSESLKFPPAIRRKVNIGLDRIEQAIAATLGSDVYAGRFAETLHDLAEEMRNIGASSMTPHELLAFFAREIDKVADSFVFAATLGSGECERFWTGAEMICSKCAHQLNNSTANYCPNCGKAVKR